MGPVVCFVERSTEQTTGRLWPEGRVDDDFTNLGLLLKAGYNATKACDSGTRVIIHTARVESGARWFYGGIRSQASSGTSPRCRTTATGTAACPEWPVSSPT